MPWKETCAVDERLRFIALVDTWDDRSRFPRSARKPAGFQCRHYRRIRSQRCPGRLKKISLRRRLPRGLLVNGA
jgi:hypothetical protein